MTQRGRKREDAKHLSDFNLRDVWQAYNPTLKEYVFCSNRHKSFSRIDFILISTSLRDQESIVKNVEIKLI